jgi:uncharacterized membrane protein
MTPAQCRAARGLLDWTQALGAASGALGGALTDFGINDKFMKDFAASLQPGKPPYSC